MKGKLNSKGTLWTSLGWGGRGNKPKGNFITFQLEKQSDYSWCFYVIK